MRESTKRKLGMGPLEGWQIAGEIARQYARTLPRVGKELDAFVAEQCAYFGIDEVKCRRYVASAQAGADAEARGLRFSRAQAAAEALQAGLVETLSVMGEGLRASNKRAVVSGGEVVKDKEGNPVFVDTPNWDARLRASDQLMKVHGGYAPKQVQVDGQIEHFHTNVDVGAELAAIAAELGLELRDVEAAFEVVPDGGGGAGAIAAPAEEAPDGEGV